MSCLYCYEHKPKSGQIKNVVMMLHGLGSHGGDLIDLAAYIEQEIPDTAFISPNAIEQYDGGYGYQWFSLQDRSIDGMSNALDKNLGNIVQFIEDKMREYSMQKVALLGFSQGVMTSIGAMLKMGNKVSCVVGFSGAAIPQVQISDSMSTAVPVCMIHGTSDDVLSVDYMERSKDYLLSLGFNRVDTHRIPGLKHSIDMKGLKICTNFLKEFLIS